MPLPKTIRPSSRLLCPRARRRIGGAAALATSVAMMLLSPRAQAADTIFLPANGTWFSGANWDSGVPTSSDTPFILTGKTASIDAPGAVAYQAAVYEGTLNVGASGTLSVSAGLFLGNGDSLVTISGAGASVNATAYMGVNAGVSTLNIANGGTLTGSVVIARDAASTGVFNLNSGGTLAVQGADAISSGAGTATFNFAGGTIQATSTTTIAQDMAVTGTTSTVNTSNTTTMSGNLTGSGALTKTGAGNLVLTGTNNYAGGTTISAGTLQVGAGGTAGSITGNVTNNSVLAFNRSDAVTFSGSIAGSGSVTKAGSGTLALTGTNTYLGGTTISAGTITASRGDALGSGTITLGDANTGASAVALLGTGVFNSDNGATPGGGELTNAIVVSNLGTGTATIGTTSFSPGGGFNSTTFSGSLTLNRATTLQGGNADRTTFTGLISGNVGTLTVTGGARVLIDATVDNTFVGNVDITGAGTILQASGNASIITDSANVNIGSGATLSMAKGNEAETINALTGTGTVTTISSSTQTLTVGAADGSGSFGGVIEDGNGTLALTKTGTGAQTLTGTNTYTGATTVDAGTLLVNGSVANTSTAVNNTGTLGGTGTVNGPVTLNSGGTITPGAAATGISIGTLTTSALTWNGGGTVGLQLGTNDAASDLLAIDGALTKGTAGAFLFEIADAGGFGDQQFYTLSTFDSTTFAAGDFSLSPLPAGFTGTFVVNANSLQLRLAVAVSGSTIQNVGGPNTPTFADFTVIGAASTAGPTDSNTINSLTFTPGSSLFIYNTLTVTSGNVSDQGPGQTSINGGILAGPNGLNFNVNGTMNVTSTLQGNLIKTGTGSLLLNGTLNGSAQVLAGLLGGNAVINGSLFNSGIVSPGNSPGTIQVSQDYTQASSGTLRIEIGGRRAGEYDQLIVGGRANLDGTLELVRLNGFNLKRGDKITFLTANGGVNGEFSTVSNAFTSNTILLPTVVYDDKAVSLEMVRGSFRKITEDWALTPNQRAVASTLDSVSKEDVNHRALVYLDHRELSGLPGDFDKIAPEELTSIFTAATSMAQVQSTNLQRRADDIRSGANGFSAAGLAVNGQTPSYSGDFSLRTGVAGPTGDYEEGKAVKTVVADEKRWGAFLSGTGEWVDVSGDGNARGYDITTGGFTLGLDYKVSSNFAIGVAAGYAGSSSDLADNGRVWVNGGKLGLYSTFFTGGFYVDAAVTGGYNSYDTKRSGLQGNVRGSTEGGELNVLVGTGYDFKVGALTIGPTATFNYTLVGMDGFTEHGSLAPLEIGQRNAESVRSALGLRASVDWKVGGVLIKPELRAAWQHEYGDKSYDLSASFAGGAGDRFLVSGPEFGRDSLLVGAGFAVQFSETVSTYFYYDGELGRENYERHSVTGGIRVAF